MEDVKVAVQGHHSLSNKLVLVLAITAGMVVANIYYNQPLLADIGRGFHVEVRQLGIISMLTQLGYAVGMFLFVPLGDMRERRRLIVTTLAFVTLSLLATTFSQSVLWLAVASFAVGVTSVVPQMVVPLAANLAPAEERGRVVGIVMSGLLVGILLARTVSGFIGGVFGWRVMYGLASVLMLVLAVSLRVLLPNSYPQSPLTYRSLFPSLGRLIRTEPVLREAALMGSMQFGAFSVFWTTLVFFLERPPYHFGSEVAGLFGLVGVAGAMIAPVAGRISDRKSPALVTGVGAIVTFFSFLVFWLWGHSLWGLIMGVILLDLGVQSSQISNQARIYSLRPDARNRINTIYMVTYFIGGAIGSSVGANAWAIWGWNGVCASGAIMVLIGIAVWTLGRIRRVAN